MNKQIFQGLIFLILISSCRPEYFEDSIDKDITIEEV